MSEARDRVTEAYIRLGGNISAVARELNVVRSTIYYHVRRANLGDKPITGGQLETQPIATKKLPARGKIKRFIVTSAQNNTTVYDGWWDNLMALVHHYDAELLVGTFSYNLNAYGKLSVKAGTKKATDRSLWFDHRLHQYIERSDNVDIMLAPGLQWCGRANIIPTAERPLSGFETYTKRASSIFPHAKMHMKSVASGKHEPSKFTYTTGTVTQRNYIQKKAGIKAEQHHCYGSLVVEVDEKGNWYVRQLKVDNEGCIQDLDVVARNGRVTTGNFVEAINWGDVHHAQIDPRVEELAWGPGGMLDVLKPKFQFMHDILDFHARSHHDRKNHHERFKRYHEGTDRVQDEVGAIAGFLHKAARDGTKTLVVDSNHDNAMERWLIEGDYKDDPPNAVYFLRTQLTKYEAMERQDDNFHLVEWALRDAQCPGDVQFLREDQDFVICHDKGGGIECGMHGHLGPNGSRGAPLGLSKMGRRANTGHTHSAKILDGMFVAGSSSKMDLGYNRGPSSWSHSHIVTYPNGKRAIVTMWDGKWRA